LAGKWWWRAVLVVGLLMVMTAGIWSAFLSNTSRDISAAPPYQEGAFGDWAETDGDDGCDQMIDALVRDIHNEKQDGCKLAGGWLVSPYTGILLEPGHDIPVVVNHVVSERWAWEHGAWKWERSARQSFYNDLDNLLVVEAGVQVVKDGRGPEEWLPDVDTCAYTQRFVEVAQKYGLTVPVETLAVLSTECDGVIPR